MVGANNLICVHTACTGKHICCLQLNMVNGGGKQFDLCPDRQTTSCSGSP